MSTTRDPRIEPRLYDELRMPDGKLRMPTGRSADGRFVRYACDDREGGSLYECTIERWRKDCAEAVVLKLEGKLAAQPRPAPDGQPIEPDENLRQQIEAAKAIEELGEDPALYHAESVAQHGAPLAKLVLDLDAHLVAGGLPPKRWSSASSLQRTGKLMAELDDVRTVLKRVLDSIAVPAFKEHWSTESQNVRSVLPDDVGAECERILGAVGKVCYRRWEEAGYAVQWDDRRYFYGTAVDCPPTGYEVRPRGADPQSAPLARLETIAKVDEWIAAHPVEVPQGRGCT